MSQDKDNKKYHKYLSQLVDERDKAQLANLGSAALSSRSLDGLTLLEEAIKNENIDRIMFLIGLGADIEIVKENLKRLTKRALIEFNKKAILFFESLGKNIKEEIDAIIDGRTPLMLAIEKRDYDAAEFLLSKGACPNCSHEPVLPLLAAQRLNDDKMIKILMEYGAEWEKAYEIYEAWRK